MVGDPYDIAICKAIAVSFFLLFPIVLCARLYLKLVPVQLVLYFYFYCFLYDCYLHFNSCLLICCVINQFLLGIENDFTKTLKHSKVNSISKLDLIYHGKEEEEIFNICMRDLENY